MFKLGIVGSSKADKSAYDQIKLYIDMNTSIYTGTSDTVVVSGGEPNGVDSIVRDACKQLGVAFKEFKPEKIGWEYFKKRNLQIAEYCDKIISFALPYGTTAGVPKCYHCTNAGKDDNHEKTAGCYTGKACGEYEVIIIK